MYIHRYYHLVKGECISFQNVPKENMEEINTFSHLHVHKHHMGISLKGSADSRGLQ